MTKRDELVGANLEAAIELRESGRVEEARRMLLSLHAESPDDPRISLQCAWTHDMMGLEREALPFYTDAIGQGLEGEDLREALLGLGSTLRVLGDHAQAAEVLRRGADLYPDAREFGPFLAMALAGVGEWRRAVGLLLRDLAQTSADEGILHYRHALLEYADEFLEEESTAAGSASED